MEKDTNQYNNIYSTDETTIDTEFEGEKNNIEKSNSKKQKKANSKSKKEKSKNNKTKSVKTDTNKKSDDKGKVEGRNIAVTFLSKKRFSIETVVLSLSMVASGILFCVLQTGWLAVLLTIVSVFVIAMGILEIVKKHYIRGLLEILIGIAVITCSWTILDITLLILGLSIIVYSQYQIVVDCPNINDKPVVFLLNLSKPMMILALGIIFIIAKWTLGNAICIVIGVFAIVDGLLMLIRTK